eukprot:14644245-Alexandrium_andersonii.AAC.1
MSASLVGSEMCIRDRGSTVQSAIHPRPVTAALRPDPQSAVRALQNRSRPVSYTHLTLPTICSV